jgi:hypothetical protein
MIIKLFRNREEGQGSQRAVMPVMMMMMKEKEEINGKPLFIFIYI